MEEIASKIVELIKDYRNDSGIHINTEHVLLWVSQFDKKDQEFLLRELLHILPKSYISKPFIINELKELFEYLRKQFKYESALEFLSHAKFLSCQGETKSQTILLKFLNEIAIKDFGISLGDCGDKDKKHWIYIDDVLASGGTFRREISAEINGYGIEKFKKEDITIIPIFFFLHTWGMNIIKYGIEKDFDKQIAQKMHFNHVFLIENDPRINRYNPNPAFNHVCPIDNSTKDWETYLDNLDAAKHRNFAYRKDSTPSVEDFYSSKENRNRYESIILNKSLEILNKVEAVSSSTRPLGLTYPNYQTFGTGSHAFTWRNISNTCPIIYWWENHGWLPLFSVENRGHH